MARKPDPWISSRQTVFYTPESITVSEGQKIRGRLSCAPNTKNNRDLDITIAYETDGGPGSCTQAIVEYKMCVVFPSFGATSPRLANSTDRWSGANCILCLSCFVALTCRKFHVDCAHSLSDELWWLGAAYIQVLINSHTCTSLEYHVVDAVHRNATVSVPVVPAGAATQGGWVGGRALLWPARHFPSARRHPTELCSAAADPDGLDCGLTALSQHLSHLLIRPPSARCL